MNSRPFVVTVQLVRENVSGQPHGPVHAVLHVKFAKKRPETMCGLPTKGMRKMGTPFEGWAEVLCITCARALEDK